MAGDTEPENLEHPSWGAQSLEGAPCIFPKLGHDLLSKNPDSHLACKVDFDVPRATHESVDVANAHLAAWSILLNLYLGANQASFGVIRQDPTQTSTTEEYRHSLSYGVCAVQAAEDGDASSLMLDCRASLEATVNHQWSSTSELLRYAGRHGRSQFNTAVCLLAGPGEDLEPAHLEGIDLALVVLGLPSSSSAHSTPFSLRFSGSHLSEEAVSLVAANYRAVASHLISNPNSPLSHLRKIGMSSEDLQKTLSWNNTCPPPVSGLVHEYIARSATLNPNSPAVCASDASLTYRELDEASNILAHFLVHECIGPESVVPLCFGKSAWATVAMLAVAKAGAAFTLLDPSFPIDTLRATIRRTGARLLLCSPSCRTMWGDGKDGDDGSPLVIHEVSPESVAALPRPRSITPPQTSVTPSSLLYVVFTSGSSGEPKGVCIEHSGYLSTSLDFIQATGMDSSSRILQAASYSFDTSIYENLTTLLCGGCVCTPDEETREEKGLAGIIRDFGVNWAYLTPSLVKTIRPDDVLPGLETLVLMGEAPAEVDIETWAGRVRLINGYGPSECCVASAVRLMPSPDPSEVLRIEAANFGWPVGGLFWVVSPTNHHHLVPVGAVGELAIEGPHMGRGYLGDDEQTARAFVDSPEWSSEFPASRSRRIYLTGDIVRRMIDGSVVFLGRKDAQVKVRGMRVELGAVEKHLCADRGVRLAVAVVPDHGTRKDRLVAVVSHVSMETADSDVALNVVEFGVSQPESELDQLRQSIRGVRDLLRLRLPGYMIPSSWFVLRSFPLRPSGKIDRRKVKEWINAMDTQVTDRIECFLDQDEREEIASLADGSNPITDTIRRQIGLVLNLPFESVSPRKSFINLGGDSISALHLKSRCLAEDIVLSTHDILRSLSISLLASCAKLADAQVDTILPEATDSLGVSFDLSPIQQLYFQWEPEGTLAGGSNRFNQSFQLRVKRPLSVRDMEQALDLMAERHAILRCRFVQPDSSLPGARWRQMIPETTDNTFLLREHLISDHEEIAGIILSSQCAIDVFSGPGFVVDLINEPQGQLLSMISHHAIIDLVSWRIIIRELEVVLQDGVGALRPQRSLSWQAWCRLQADYASRVLSPRVALPHHNRLTPPNLEYWWMEKRENKFGNVTRAVVNLDSPTTSLLMGPKLHEALRTEPVDLFLSAVIHSFAEVFHDREPPIVFRESHGREPWDDSIDVSSTVGWFTTMYPILIETNSIKDDLLGTLRRVKDAQRCVPSNGWSYFASRFLHPDGVKDFGSSAATPEIVFDFLGLYQQLERPDGLFGQEIFFPEEYDIGPEFHRPGLFEITAEIVRGCLRLKFEYNKSMKHQAAITTWVQKCEESLHAFVSVLNQARHLYTLSDFPLLTTGYDGLDNLFSSILPELGVPLNNVEDVYDTSPMQTGLLLSQSKEPSLYQCFTVFQVTPVSRSHSIDLQRLEEAWIKLVQRHSALRTIFIPDMVSRDGAFCQVVLKMVEPRILKLTCLASERDAVLREPLSLPVRDALPPHRLTIIEAGDGSTFVRMDINHACIDGASGDILVRDFISLYHGGVQLPEAPAYRELVSFTQGRDPTKELEYWTDVLKHVQPCHLPILDDGVVQDGSLQVTQAKSLPSLDTLNAFCKSHNITLPTVFKLAWSLVLRAYTGSDNPCFGYLVSGRDDLDADDDRSRINKENAIGAFVNILACRCNLSDTLDAVLRGIQEDSLRDLQYQYCSLAHIQRNMLGPGSGQPQQQRQQALFNTILNFQVHQPHVALSEALIALEPVYIHEPTEYNAIIDIHVTSDSLEVALGHWTSSLCPGQAQHVVDAFSAALTSLLGSSLSATITARDMDLVGSGQQKQLWAWNETVPPRVDECIHNLISLNVAAYPAAPAVESWDGSYTYEELEDATTRLARHLAHIGIGVGSTVPLCFEKSAWAVISMLAVLKAGGSFLLLDPKHVSADRTMGIVKDMQARFVLASKKESMLLNDLVTVLGVKIFLVDDSVMAQVMSCPNCLKDDLSETHSSLIRVVTPLDPAYIIFTSATTGQPKGIVTSHSAFCTAAQAQGRRLKLSRSSRMLQYASYSFDASIAEIIMPLFFGGCVCVPSERQKTDGITDMINETQVNFAILTPTVARLVATTDIPGVKALVLCGEPMARLDIAQWKGHVRLMNAYGPSECGVSTAVNDCVSDDPTNIGHQAGCICWVVDPEDSERLVPIGGVGELIIEGFNLADGYLNNEEKTRQAFVNPPSWLVEQRSKSHGEDAVPTRVYKTGDLIRLNSDGSIKFIGRKDTQSKLHGQRIELHEIEQHILSHYDALGTLAVEVIEPEIRKGSQTLAAFITPARGKGEEDDTRNGPEKTDIHGENNFLELPQDLTVQFQALQTALASILSPYMIPTLFIALSAFPLSPSGKLDRRTLRRNAAKIPATLFHQYSLAGGASQERLETEAEETLRKAWVKTLGVQSDMIGRKTSFTRLGGDSLAAMRLASLARSKYGLAIAVADIFKRPRLCDMASEMGVYDLGSGAISSQPADIKPFELLDSRDKSVDWLISTAAVQCRVGPGDILDMYPCTPLQEGLMAISVEKQGAYLHRGVFPLPRKTVDLNRLKRAWEVVVAANPILRTRFVSIEGTGNMQVVLDQSITWLHPVACSKEKYLADDLDIALAWGSPLNRFAILEPADNADGDEESCLVWTAHHGLFDEWSLNLTLEQLQKAYRQEELPAVLPFNHFIAHINAKDEAACAAYWTSQLAGDAPPATIPQLPTNTYVPRISGSHSRLISVTRSRSAGAHITTPTILRAAWALITGRYANSANAEHVIFGASVSGRSAAVEGVERINGPTLATVPVKVYLGREQPISGFLEDIQAQAADMIEYEHWGLHNMAGVSRNVAFQNLFVVHLPDGRSSSRSSTKSDGADWNEPPDGLKMIASTHADYHVYALVAECFLQEDNQSFTIRMSYDGQVVPYAARLASHFDWLIQQLIDRAEDESPLGTLDFCSAEDKLRIREWNHEDPKIVEDCIHEIVSRNAAQRPNAPAIRAWDFDLTYAQLDAMSAKLARHLVHDIGVRVEQIVPAIFEKSAWAVVSQLAVLKAGGVMCMLDPAHPPQRLEDQIDITEAHFILASELYSDLLRQDGRTVLTIDASTMQSISEGVEESETEIETETFPSAIRALPTVKPENAAYVVFTSGTTGRPKASITEHRSFVSCSASFAVRMHISQTSRSLQHAAYSFDPYIVETFSTLTQGGCVCLARDEARTNPAELIDVIQELGVNWAMMTPSVGRLLPRNEVPSLKTLILCGEALSQTDRFWSNTVRLMNVYGPSECSVVSALNNRVTLDSDCTAIGKGAGSRCWIAEPHNHNLLTPVGCVGELLLDSVGLARGYLGQPGKTAEVFVHGAAWLEEFGRPGNSRMYKTGDLVRYDPADGMISFVGRKDMQLKLHGQRFEPGEVEHHLMAHEQVRIAAVIHPKAGRFKGRLVATLALGFTASTTAESNAILKLVSGPDRAIASLQINDIKMRLEAQVPSYMVPSVWAVVYRVPLTPSAKIGKRDIASWLESMSHETADAIMAFAGAYEEDASLPSNNEMEQRLRQIVARVLGLDVDQVLLGRSFISLGGDSITAIQAMARCRSENITVQTKDILQSKSIRHLAERVQAIADTGGKQNLTASKIHEGSAETEFHLSPVQKLYFEAGLGQMRSRTSSPTSSSHYNQSVLVRFTREVTPQEVSRAVQAIVEQHVMLRASFTETDGVWKQRILPSADVLPMVQHDSLSQADSEPIMAEAQCRLDAVSGAVFCAHFFDIREPTTLLPPSAHVTSQQYQRLFMAAHHLVIDLVSWRIILQDLEEFLSAGKLLSRNAVSFQAWTRMQAQQISQTSQALQDQHSSFQVPEADCRFWGISPDTNIFGDTLSAGFTLDAETTSSLLGPACNERLRTKPEDLFVSALLSSFAAVFPERGGASLPPVYCEGHGRECAWDGSVDLSSTVGWLTVIHPLQVQLASAGDSEEAEVGKALVDAICRVKDARARVVGKEWSYFASRSRTGEGQGAFASQWPMEILFNYIGGHQKLERDDALLVQIRKDILSASSSPLEQLEGSSSIHTTTDVGPKCRRLALFDVNVQLSGDGRATFTFTFNCKTRHRARVHAWISNYRNLLESAVERLASVTPEPTLSDFPQMPHLTYQQLDRIKDEIVPALRLSSLADIAAIYPCGPTQKGILISQARSASSYRESFLYVVTSGTAKPVDMGRLEAAWKAVVARHDALRTVIIEDTMATDQGFYQVVLREFSPRVQQVKYTDGIDGGEDDEECLTLDKMRKLSASTASTTAKALNPEHSLLLCRTANRVYLYLEISHALIDGFSMPVLLNDIAMAYDGLRLESAGELRPPSFGDYVAHVEGLSADDSFAYWISYLDGVPSCHFPVLKESTIRQSLDASDARETWRMQSIPAELGVSSEPIFDFCLEHGLTPASVFRMAWALVLRAYTGMDDVCFGFLASGRDAPVEGIESIIGVVCNMLIVRVNLGNDNSKTGVKMLEAMQDSWSNSLNHQFVSLADVLHRHQQQPSAGPSASSRRPEAMFNTGMSFFAQNKSDDIKASFRESSLSFDALGGDDGAEYDVTVNVWPAANGLGFRASINYRASHMTAVQARGVSRTFSRAVECIMEMSHRPLAEWCLIREGDAQNAAEQTTALGTNTDINPYGSSCVDEVISATAKKNPDGPAVCSWDGQLTYRELETLSTQLAIHLVDHHAVGPEVLVPVCMEKSLWFIVAVVAVLKAGAAFVPMDATQPGRFQTVFEQTNARLVLTSETVRKQLSSNHQVDRTIAPLVVDAEFMEQLAPVTSNHAQTHLSNRSRHAAYVIFTSGSTGMPKGVVIEHSAWCSSAAGLIHAIRLGSRARVLQFASYNFDAAVCEILCTLMSGGCLCIPSEAERMDNVEAAINRMKVDTLTVTPSFVATLQPENICSVHTIVLVGESTPEHQIQRWLGRVRLMLGYGPTECSVMSSIVDCPSVSPLQSNNIGFPRNCKYWIVNPADHNVLAPPGFIGELLIEGTKLSRGYLNDPPRTASAFITNPPWANRCVGETRRMYKTGDLVQLNADGSYRYTGRKDRQVKINGQRVELGEIEHRAHQVLRRKYQVAVEAVDIGGSGSREVRLVAFAAAGDECEDFPLVSSGRDSRQTASAFEARHKFRATMMASVPSYMVPSVILPLRQLPHLPSHKIDRNELRRIGFDFLTDSSSPRNSSSLPDRVELTVLQQRLRQLWASVLNKDAAAISLEDTFLDLGGDSILAIKLVNTCRSAGLAISIANILRHQSLGDLCRILETDVMGKPSKADMSTREHTARKPLSSLGSLATSGFVEEIICPRVGVSPSDIQDTVEASPSQMGFIESSILKGRGSTNYFAFHLRGHIDEYRLREACYALVASHTILRTSFVPFKQRLFQVILRSIVPDFQATQCPESQQQDFAADWVKADQLEPVTLGQPMLRFLFLGGESESIMVMRLSHAQYDGMSMQILIDDLVALYQGQTAPTNRPTFTDFILAARESERDGAQAYWDSLLGGARMTDIVTHLSPAYESGHNVAVSRTIVTPRHVNRGFTFATTLKAAWALVLAELSSSTDVVFGHIVSGRSMSIDGLAVDDVLGPCLNIIPVRVQLRDSNTTVGSILRQVHDQHLGAMPFETFAMDKMLGAFAERPRPWRRFSSVVQYQNLDGRLEALEDFGFGDGVRCRVTAFEGQFDPADILVLATPTKGGELTKVELRFAGHGREGILPSDLVEHILNTLLARIDLLSSAVRPDEQQLMSVDLTIPPLIPVPAERSASLDRTAAAAAAGYSFETVPVQIRELVTQAWDDVLGSTQEDDRGQELSRTSRASAEIPFYDVWGSFLAAAQLAEFYGRHGGVSALSVEDIMEHPSMLAQSLLLARRLSLSVHPSPPSLLLFLFPIHPPWWITVRA
ncbi:hypothetical protein BKA56DRAFT_661273 [Ilyonectria sp. MPI-CAGE-AT-0026]|nr:hypothetical protein BKA56DRAFT_661273 [Ilyonectria sp. MPI-CAGE-AT-0026]